MSSTTFVERLRCVGALDRAQRARRRGRAAVGSVGSIARPRGVSSTVRRSDCVPAEKQRPAVAHEAAQRARDAAVEPARVAGEDHAAVAGERRALLARERDVGREVVAVALAVELGEQQRLLLGQLRRQPALDERASDAHRQPAPRACRGARRRRRRRGWCPARSSPAARRARRGSPRTARRPARRPCACACAPRRGTGPTCRRGAVKRTTREREPRPRLRISRSPTRRSVQVKRRGDETATAARVAAVDGLGVRLRGEVAHGDPAAPVERPAVRRPRRHAGPTCRRCPPGRAPG